MASEGAQNALAFAQTNCDENHKSEIRRLPNDILALFFIEAVSTKTNKELWADANHSLWGHVRSPVELNISQVCRRWRAISLDLSVLWRTFYFSFERNSHLPTIMARFQTYIERSRVQLLDLWFDLASVPNNDSFALVEHAMQYSARLRRLSIFLHPTVSTLQRVSDCVSTLHAPNLEYLAIHPHDYENDDNEIQVETITDPLQSDPSILPGSLKLSSFWFDISAIPHFLPPLSSIATLRIDSSAPHETIHISMTVFLSIVAIPGLEHLSLAGDIIDYDDILPVMFVTVPNLKHLQIVGALTPVYLLNFIRAPLLDVLILDKTTIYAPIDKHKSETPFPALRVLVLLDVHIECCHSGFTLLNFTENINTLVISDSGERSNVLCFIEDALINSQDDVQVVFWPKLQDVTLAVLAHQPPNFYKDFLTVRPVSPSGPLVLHTYEYVIDLWQEYDPECLAVITKQTNLVPMKNDCPIIVIKEGWHLGRGAFKACLDTYDTFEIDSHPNFASYSLLGKRGAVQCIPPRLIPIAVWSIEI